MSNVLLNPTNDHRVYRDDDPGVYNTVHDQASGSFKDDNISSYSVINRKTGGGPEVIIVRCSQVYTHGLSSSATAISASLVIRITDILDTDSDSFSVVESKQASTTNIALSDYSLIGNAVTGPDKFATDTTFASMSIGADSIINLNATALAYINTQIASGGKIMIGLRTAQDCAKTTPTGNNYVTYDGASGTNPPVLSITYTIPTITINAPVATINLQGMTPTTKVSMSAPVVTINILGVAPTLSIIGETWTNISKNAISPTNISKNAMSPIGVSKNSSLWTNQSKN